jgi:hypothetical protein
MAYITMPIETNRQGSAARCLRSECLLVLCDPTPSERHPASFVLIRRGDAPAQWIRRDRLNRIRKGAWA